MPKNIIMLSYDKTWQSPYCISQPGPSYLDQSNLTCISSPSPRYVAHSVSLQSVSQSLNQEDGIFTSFTILTVAISHAYLSTISSISQPYLSKISAESHPAESQLYLICISAISQPYFSHILALFQQHLSRISDIFPPYLSHRISTESNLYLNRI